MTEGKGSEKDLFDFRFLKLREKLSRQQGQQSITPKIYALAEYFRHYFSHETSLLSL